MTREEFNEVYWAAQPPAVRALRSMPAGADRTQAALELAQKGFQVDVMIGVYGFEPFGTMSGRMLNGFKWSPALLQDYQLAMFPLNPWEIGPTAPMPKGAIKTSLNPADYPPFDPPVENNNQFPAATNPVGPQVSGNIYQGNFGDNKPLGFKYIDERGTFVKQGTATPFGTRMWWEKVS